MRTQVEQAAYNNARWCDAVCRAHGIPGEFHESLWLNRHPVPRFYPNAVTLSNTRGLAEQRALIQDLIATSTLPNLAIKDSFCALDPAPFACHLLFEATWLWRSTSLPKPLDTATRFHWGVVTEPSDLARWETAWNGPSADDQSLPPARIFLPALLTDNDIAFVAAHQDGHIVAGAIANRSGDVVGISNVFTREEDAPRFWAGCVATVMDQFPGLPLVGYESGSELVIARQCGFAALGPLRVWAWARSST
ncbi:MAG: hypothetical protein M1546_00625 [Chloroflexi bacterium]|nr:hypothetical protein [Chloroflexota bacterium]